MGPIDIKGLTAKKRKLEESVDAQRPAGGTARNVQNKYLSNPVSPDKAISMFLIQARNSARNYLPKSQQKFPIKKPFCEIEARLGVLGVPHSSPMRRVTSSGAKTAPGTNAIAPAFECSSIQPRCIMDSGVSRSHFFKWTSDGNHSAVLKQAFGISAPNERLHEEELIETVYSGYPNGARVCFAVDHDPAKKHDIIGQMESKEKLSTMDLTLPAAPYDLRVTLSSENIMDPTVRNQPPNGWTSRRIKRRRSYTRSSMAWQLDVTEVTTHYKSAEKPSEVTFEIELEIRASVMLDLINEEDQSKINSTAKQLASQAWWILSQLNPLADALDVDEQLRDHPNQRAVQLALAQCGALKRFMDGGANVASYESPIANPSDAPLASLSNVKFIGCMPVNFSRHDMDHIQRADENAYFLSEKTDGVRHLMVFTGDTVVLVDRAMRGKQPVWEGKGDPFAQYIHRIKPGTVLDGEVVMNRKNPQKPRPLFIVFDVLTISTTEPVLHLPFANRLEHLRRGTFSSNPKTGDPMDHRALTVSPPLALPLMRKNFVTRTAVGQLLANVHEERGMRCFRKGDAHNHLTDGIIFQPNRPYVCGTDVKLLKWKYLDTVTMDVELLKPRHNEPDDAFCTGCLGEESTMVNMTRFVQLPAAERMRFEADRFAAGQSSRTIAEVGLDPDSGEWYYLTLRPDKVAPNHISTVLGTLMELAERLSTEELRFRLSLPPGSRDTFRKDVRGMMKQLLDHQEKRLKKKN
eukprot:CAMPEP_0172454760 /NCGR_PEP_ID=MMETSP1065-20121228/11651_1 /TAXON_ID=265537 /ORGANISM="Amphiprora paludosa, Strain CCMP125" /LENGTH=746 /DNA_ID=CAMNT_0013207145 /DNA_START=15 /DNA_END=2255 /DNA_ORIENTATION=+